MYAPGFGFGKDGTAIAVVIIVVYVGVLVVKEYLIGRKKRKEWMKKYDSEEGQWFLNYPTDKDLEEIESGKGKKEK